MRRRTTTAGRQRSHSGGLVRAPRWWSSSFFSESRRRWPTVRIGCVVGVRGAFDPGPGRVLPRCQKQDCPNRDACSRSYTHPPTRHDRTPCESPFQSRLSEDRPSGPGPLRESRANKRRLDPVGICPAPDSLSSVPSPGHTPVRPAAGTSPLCGAGGHPLRAAAKVLPGGPLLTVSSLAC